MNRLHPAALLVAALPAAALAQAARDAAIPTLDRVTVTGSRPSTLPLEIPTTTEGVTRRQIEQSINATDAQDALKYFPSLLVRKRYIGDYDHAVLATRASGTGNSARSLVYADGILLSNLLGNGAFYTPRWGLVTPEEIERVDVLYGPFSAAYSGNSAGAVVDYVTRMPTRLEAHVKLQGFSERFQLYGRDDRFGGGSASASIGSREGAWAWWVNVNRLESRSHPLSYVVKASPSGSGGVPVSGATAALNPSNVPGWIVGDTGETRTVQDHAKLKLAYDVTPTVRAAYTLGHWRSDNQRTGSSYLRDAAGAGVSSGGVSINGVNYTLGANDFAPSRSQLEHWMQGLSVKSRTGGAWDWEAALSTYRYRRDEVASRATAIPGSAATSPGLTDQSGSGWRTAALKGIWRPTPGAGGPGSHVVEFGAQHDAYRLRTVIPRDVGATTYGGEAELRSLWAQDAWRFAAPWRAVLGLRVEQWRAFNAQFAPVPVPASGVPRFADRDETYASPKAAVSYQWNDEWTLKASLGRALRMPTLTEQYQVQGNEPHLRPERSWTTEWSAERAHDGGLWRATVFAEHTRDALYAQRKDLGGGTLVNAVQNVDAIRTLGLELALQAQDVGASLGMRGLEVSSSLTYADSRITRNDAFPASVNHWQPRVPRWRASLLATWRVDPAWSLSLGSRYSGQQYGTLDNSDPNGESYTGFSRFWVTDVRAQYRVDKHWSAAFGIDNLNNERYWAFHPYNQRTLHAELRYDL